MQCKRCYSHGRVTKKLPWEDLSCKIFCHEGQTSDTTLLGDAAGLFLHRLNTWAKSPQTKRKEPLDCSEVWTGLARVQESEPEIFLMEEKGPRAWRVDGREGKRADQSYCMPSNQPAHSSGFEVLSAKKKPWELWQKKGFRTPCQATLNGWHV